MKPARFDYYRARTVDEAAEMLFTSGGKILAGGQSLVPLISMRLASPPALVDLNHVEGLADVEVGSHAVRIGALVRHRALEQHPAAYAANPLLRRALQHVAHPTIRNRGTTVGSLVHADPAAEMTGVLALLGGRIEAVSQARGPREIRAAEFFTGPMECCLLPDEVAIAATYPHPPPGTGSSWHELARRHGDYAMVGVGAVVGIQDARVVDAKVVLISVSATPCVVDLSDLLGGRRALDLDCGGVDEAVMAAIEPETDIHASADYRAQLAKTLTARAVTEAAREAREQVAA